MANESGMVFAVQRFCVDDGPGIRTVVFLKGCPLRCCWCHNPESWHSEPEPMFDAARCIKCGHCAKGCPSGARVIMGKIMTVAEVMADAEKDRDFYEFSHGGVTLSGGEPMAQPDFTLAILRECRQRGFHTALETCGFSPWEKLAATIPQTGLYLFDFKADSQRHCELTGVSRDLIDANLQRLSDAGAMIYLRIPLVNVNLTPRFTAEIIAAAKRCSGIKEIHLLPFHRLGLGKMEKLGLPDATGGLNLTAPSAEQLAVMQQQIDRATGIKTIIPHAII